VHGAEPVEAPPNAPLTVPNHKVRVRPVRWKTVWQKPEPGWVKVNTYASFVLATHSGSGGVGMKMDRIRTDITDTDTDNFSFSI
jgi:hypothetical protein